MLTTALLLGVLEGLTEFLPVSSTGHLILFGSLLGFQGPTGTLFDIVIQLGAILAVCWLYRHKLRTTAAGLMRRERVSWRFASGLACAFLPAALLGALFHGFIKTVLFNSFSVSLAFVVGGVVILAAERYKPAARFRTLESFSLPLCLKIGLCQCLALIPGTSRSGATIIGALLLGVERPAATEFSFFLAIPTMVAATGFDLYKNWQALSLEGAQLIVVGFVTAFFSAVLVVRWLVTYVARHGFEPFAWYRIVVGLVSLGGLR